MGLLSALQFRKSARPARNQEERGSLPAPTTEGWHPDLAAGTLRWHGPGGVPTERLARWHD